jgi:hypothetical protein
LILVTLTPQGLVETVSLYLGMSEGRVKNYDRRLMEAGLRTKKGHGRGSAIMTMKDAAMLLIAIASTDEINDAAATTSHLWDFPLHESFDPTPFAHTVGTSPRQLKKLGPALCELMGFMASDRPKDKDAFLGLLQVTLSNSVPVWAKIAIYEKEGVSELDYRKKAPASVMAGGLQVQRLILGPAIQAIAKRVAGAASEAAA